MGKLVTYLTILLVVDLLFIVTGQLCVNGTCSLSSTVLNAALNIGDIPNGELFSQLIGDLADLFNSAAGIAALVVGAVVSTGIIFGKSDSILFIPIGFTLAFMAGDFVFIYAYLASLNSILATLVMAPLTVIYIVTVVEWVRGKD